MTTPNRRRNLPGWLLTVAVLACTIATLDGARQRGANAPPPKNDPNRQDWVQLFNGRDLDGWTTKFAKHDLGENFNDTFRVENGLLEVRYDKWTKFDGEFGHIFYKDPFSYYRIAAEYRFVGEQVAGGPAWAMRNNGLMLHSPNPKTMLKDQDFPISIEVQLLGGLGDGRPRTTANLCTPGSNVVMNGKLHTAHCTNSTSKTYDGDQWVRVEVVVHGDELMRHIVEGAHRPRVHEAADRRRRRRAGRSGGQGRRHADDVGLHLHPGGDGADRLPQDRAPQSRGLHGSEGVELQGVLRQGEPADVPVAGTTSAAPFNHQA